MKGKVLTYMGNYVDIARLDHGIYLTDHPEILESGATLDLMCHARTQLASFKADYNPYPAIDNIRKCVLINIE